MRDHKKDEHKDAGHEMAFRPAKDISRKVKADFVHMTELHESKKNKRDAEGNVITEPQNFKVSPVKKGQVGKG